MDKTKAGSLFKGILRKFLWVLLILLALGLAAYLVLLPMAGSKESSVEKKWAEAGLPIAGFLESLPRMENNQAAEKLSDAVLKLGFSLRPRELKEEEVPQESAKVWEVVNSQASDYGKAELEKPGPETAPPPAEVAAFLGARSADLAEIRALLKAEVPLWLSHPEKGYSAPIPNLLGQINLARLLTADALAAHAGGNDALALEDMDALWRLSEGLEKRPELISQLILIALRKMAVPALRKLDGHPAIWKERLSGWNPLDGVLMAHRYEGAVMGVIGKREGLSVFRGGDSPGLVDGTGAAVTRPYIRLCVAGTQEIMLDCLQRIKQTSPCFSDEDVKRAGELRKGEVPKWNVIAAVATPSFSNAFIRAKYARIQVEMTDKVLELKAARASGGSWPASLPGIETSFCPKEKWTYTVSPDGSISLKYSGPEPSSDVIKGHRPPHEYREGGKKVEKLRK